MYLLTPEFGNGMVLWCAGGGGGRDVNAKLNEVACAMENPKGILLIFII